MGSQQKASIFYGFNSFGFTLLPKDKIALIFVNFLQLRRANLPRCRIWTKFLLFYQDSLVWVIRETKHIWLHLYPTNSVCFRFSTISKFHLLVRWLQFLILKRHTSDLFWCLQMSFDREYRLDRNNSSKPSKKHKLSKWF